jgi:predicted glutamine amidotransferase
MCRWIVFVGSRPHRLGDVLSKPTHSLISQAFSASYHPGFTERNNATLNADGFGACWFSADGRCFTYRSTSPAWSDPNFRELVEFIESSVIFGHVSARRSIIIST